MNNNRIRQLGMSTQIITTIAGTGDQAFTGDGGSATAAKLYGPFSVYYDKSNGDIYIADTFNNRIRRVRDGIISTVVGTTCTGSDELGDGEQATDACLNTPSHFTMNDAGEWFIADNENNRIRKVFLNSTITTVAGGGTMTGDGPATSVQLSMPEGIAFTPSGEMFVTESAGLFRGIRKMEKSGFMKIIAGGGSEAPSSNNSIPGKTAFIQPVVVAHARDGSDTIFIGDNRGYIYKLTSITKCYGIESDNSAVCSGHGSCISLDECECDSGWMGLDCSITHCFGISSNLPNRACSGKGKCVRPNKCHCEAGYRGHKCHRPINSLMMQ